MLALVKINNNKTIIRDVDWSFYAYRTGH